MSFVTTQPEALSTAAMVLEHLGSALAAENSAAAPATTGVIPAAADQVSALQAAQFTAYGTWYQQVSAQARAVHQQLVNNLSANAGSYGYTEAANQAATASASSSGALSGATSAQGGAGGDAGASFATFGTPYNWLQNTGAAASDFIALGQGQFLPGAVSWDPTAPGAAGAPFMPTAVGATTATSGIGASPVQAGFGEASALGRLSVPPGWATGGVVPANPAPATLAGAGWSGVAHQAAPVTAMPAGLPSVASAGRAGHAIGAPSYGVKPVVMRKPAVV